MSSCSEDFWSCTLRRLTRLRELRTAEWLVLCQLVPAAAVALIASRHTRLERLVERIGEQASAMRSVRFPWFYDRLTDAEVYRLADWATRLTAGDQRCLQRSLVMHWLLSRHGASPTLEVGVALRDGQLLSHAWVTVGGDPVGETALALAPFRTILRLGVK